MKECGCREGEEDVAKFPAETRRNVYARSSHNDRIHKPRLKSRTHKPGISLPYFPRQQRYAETEDVDGSSVGGLVQTLPMTSSSLHIPSLFGYRS